MIRTGSVLKPPDLLDVYLIPSVFADFSLFVAEAQEDLDLHVSQ